MNLAQQEQKEKNIMKTLETYKKYRNELENIKDLSKITGIHNNTIQRYLHDPKFLDSLNDEEREYLDNWLITSKKNGNKKGGKISQELHGYSKDIKGHFKGTK